MKSPPHKYRHSQKGITLHFWGCFGAFYFCLLNLPFSFAANSRASERNFPCGGAALFSIKQPPRNIKIEVRPCPLSEAGVLRGRHVLKLYQEARKFRAPQATTPQERKSAFLRALLWTSPARVVGVHAKTKKGRRCSSEEITHAAFLLVKGGEVLR